MKKLMMIALAACAAAMTGCVALEVEDYGYEAVNRLLETADVPRCTRCGGVIKPDIVFFGENVKYLDQCQRLCSRAELLFVLGSSLNVSPAALLPQMCSGSIVVVNRGEVSSDYLPPSRIALRVDDDLDAFFKEVDAILKEKKQIRKALFVLLFLHIMP